MKKKKKKKKKLCSKGKVIMLNSYYVQRKSLSSN